VTKELTTAILEAVEQLLQQKDETSLCPAICASCGNTWALRKSSDSQFTIRHSCPREGRRNVRISIEPIGRTKAERDQIGYDYRMAVK
jgi:hypothetical protein